jgi:hypothetical protein
MWAYDVQAVVRWLCDRAYNDGLDVGRMDAEAKAAEKTSPSPTAPAYRDPVTGEPIPDDDISEEEARRRKEIENWRKAKRERELSDGLLVYVDDVITNVAREYREVSDMLSALKSKIEARLVNMGVPLDDAERLVAEPIEMAIERLVAEKTARPPGERDEDDDDDDPEGDDGSPPAAT